jgi:hypothetical protein
MYTIVAPVPANLAKVLEPHRQKYDPAARLTPPHILILEPFQFAAAPEQLYAHLSEICETHAPIKVFLVGWHVQEGKDYQLHLPMTAGQAELTSLRNDLLTGPLSALASSEKTYQPQVLFGRLTDQANLELAKQDLKGFEPLFNFRVSRLELWRRDEVGQPWQVEMKFALKATLTGRHKREEIHEALE